MNEYIIKVTTIVDDYYVVEAPSVEDAYMDILESIFNSEDTDIIDSNAYIKEISYVDLDEDEYIV